MDQTLVLEDRVGKSIILTLNRPEVMNSFNFALLREFGDKVERLQWDPEVRVIIITGAGEKAFCAGADLKERASLGEDQVRQFIFTIRNLFTFHRIHEKARDSGGERRSHWGAEPSLLLPATFASLRKTQQWALPRLGWR